ncbi:MAG: slipin family protein, partial [Elusimicrobiales bacterium]|nr:slipin family protein [Elusimicrobiales bacterium]
MAMLPIIILLIFLIMSAINVLNEYERGVVFTLGRFSGVRGPGLVVIIPIVQRMVKIDTRVVTFDVPSQDIITKDNIPVKVNAVVYFRVIYPDKAVLNVERYMYSTSQFAQTTLRSVLGQQELDDLLTNREKINQELQKILDQHTEPWGIKVSAVEIKNVDIPQEMQRAIARQAEAERERRAKIINADGEYQAAQKLIEASKIISQNPVALQLRYLQTLTEIATENQSTVVFPIPIELLKAFTEKKN